MFFLFLLCFAFPVFGGNLSPLQTGLGDAGAASLKGDFSHFINPAVLAFQSKSTALLAYAIKDRDQSGLLGLQDRQSGLPLGLAYSRTWKRSGQTENKWTASVAQKVGSYFAFGLNVHRDHLKPPWNADVGLLFKPAEESALGVVLGNLTISRNLSGKGRKKILTFGVYQGLGEFLSLRADASRLKKRRWVFKGGLETSFYDFLKLKVGGVWTRGKKPFILTGGAGFYGQRMHLEYGTQKQNSRWDHILAATLIF